MTVTAVQVYGDVCWILLGAIAVTFGVGLGSSLNRVGTDLALGVAIAQASGRQTRRPGGPFHARQVRETAGQRAYISP